MIIGKGKAGGWKRGRDRPGEFCDSIKAEKWGKELFARAGDSCVLGPKRAWAPRQLFSFGVGGRLLTRVSFSLLQKLLEVSPKLQVTLLWGHPVELSRCRH